MPIGSLGYQHIWLVDFEYSASPGERPDPVCLVALELRSGRKLRLWQDQLNALSDPPYETGRDSLLVTYYGSAEIGCHLALGWALPANLLDLYTEFRNLTNGKDPPCGDGLLGALAWYGLDSVQAAEKAGMRELALRGGPWSSDESKALLDYCESDVMSLAQLLPRMLPKIDMPRALLRGQYMIAAAKIEHTGIPIDTHAHAILRGQWSATQDRLIARIDRDYHVFDGRTFKTERWAQWLTRNHIPWPKLKSGGLALDDDTFREMARSYPQVAPIRELRVSLSQMRLADLAVGRDGRNRCLLSAFRARTGRNQPSNTRFIFGPAVWLRGLIRPTPGYGLAYVDWAQQEFGIAAALSGDAAMMAAYESRDPYLEYAKQAGAVPVDATKVTHGETREVFKTVALAVQYGMGHASLARQLQQPVSQTRELLRLHHQTYQHFWRWSDAAVDYANLSGRLYTVFGWTLHVGPQINDRSLRNFPMQANGAEMLRLACCFVTGRGISLCAPVHDALLIEAPLSQLEETVMEAQAAMAEASAGVLSGFRLRSNATLIRHPERFEDGRGRRMWAAVWDVIRESNQAAAATPPESPTVHPCNNPCAPAHTRSILLYLSHIKSLPNDPPTGSGAPPADVG